VARKVTKAAPKTSPSKAAAVPQPQPMEGVNRTTAPATASKDRIQILAYLKWEAAGKPCGDGSAFWLEAERELSQSHK
jgi:hypothetical protein